MPGASRYTVLSSSAHQPAFLARPCQEAGLGFTYCKFTRSFVRLHIMTHYQQRSGKASIHNIPLGSNLFGAAHTIKKTPKASTSTSVSEPGPSSHAPESPTPFRSPHGFPNSPFPYYGFPPNPTNFYSTPYGFPVGTPQWPSQVSSSSHPRSSPPPAGVSLDMFCAQYSLSDTAKQGLEALGFEPGDDLSVVTEAEYKEAGFARLSWDRVLRAYRKYKQDQK